jgi:hypothetical protein
MTTEYSGLIKRHSSIHKDVLEGKVENKRNKDRSIIINHFD